MSRFELTHPDCPITTVVNIGGRVPVPCGTCGGMLQWMILVNFVGDRELAGHAAPWCETCRRPGHGAA
jgi:hypothetical protein